MIKNELICLFNFINRLYNKLKHAFVLYVYFFIRYFSFRKFFNIVLSIYEYKSKKVKIKSVPFRIYFDVSDFCILDCPLCPTGRKDKGQYKSNISFENFKIIFDKYKEYLFFIRLYNWGEPLLCKDLFKIIDYCHKNNVGIQLHSNFNFFNEKILKNIVRFKVDYLHLSIDGYTQKCYEFYRRKGKINKVFYGLNKLIQYKKEFKSKYPVIHWGYLLNNKNMKEVDKAYAYSKTIGVDIFEANHLSLFNVLDDKYNQDTYLKFLSNVKNESACASNKSKSHCTFLWIGISITSRGLYCPCYFIYNDSDMFGNLNDKKNKTIGDVYNSEIFIESRKLFKIKNYKAKCFTPCERCDCYTKA